MTNENKNKWSVIINIALTTLTAILSALGFTVGQRECATHPFETPLRSRLAFGKFSTLFSSAG